MVRNESSSRLSYVSRLLRPLARKVVFRSLEPTPLTSKPYEMLFDMHWLSRELYEWARRSLLATPAFLSKCAVHGTQITVDRIPYITNLPRIELGSNIRISGQLNIKGSSLGKPVLRIGSGVFIGHGTSITVAERVEIGDFVSIGGGTYIADTEGHSHYNPQQPIWNVPANDEDIAPVIIEDNVQISTRCMILKGVRIGARSVIGAGSVVRTNIPPDSVVMGNPARVVKKMAHEQPIQTNGSATHSDA